MPKCGVKLSFLLEFVESCGGRWALTGKTTADVCEAYVKKVTEQYRCSLSNLLEAMNHGGFGAKAEILSLMHGMYVFLDVVDILMSRFRDHP